MSSMNLLLVGDINTYAASLFQKGSYTYAKTKFVQALEMLDNFVELRDQDLIHTEDVILEGGKVRCFADTPLNSPYPNYIYSVAPTSQKKDACCDQELYSAVFLLSSDIPIMAEVVAAVIFFNLGLYYHKKSMSAGKHNSHVKALHLYRHSLAVLHEQNYLMSDALLVLEAALYYNQAHIHQVFMDDTETAINLMAELATPIRDMAKSENVLAVDLFFFEDGLALFEDTIGTKSACEKLRRNTTLHSLDFRREYTTPFC